MATTANTPTACKDGSGDVISLEFSGTSDCSDLRIEVYDAATGDLLVTGPVSHNGANWDVSFSVQSSDFAAGDIACDGMLDVKLKCRDTSPSHVVFSDSLQVSCVDCDDCSIVIGSVEGVAAGTAGLQSLTVNGTANLCTQVKVTASTSGGAAVEKEVPVVNGQWQAVFNSGDPGVGSKLKDYNCKAVVSIEVSCSDRKKKCSAKDSKPVACKPPNDPRKCPDTADVLVTGPNNFSKTNPTDAELECVPPGNYTIKCTTPAAAYKWRSGDALVTGANSALQVVSVSGDTMVVSLAGNDNKHFSVTAEISDICEPLRTVAFHCGGKVDCVVSEWSNWSECRNGRQHRTRTVLVPPSNGGRVCPPLEEERDCRETVAVDCVASGFSPWSNCVHGQQSKTRTIVTPASNGGRPCPALTETRACTDVIVNLCLLWMFINLGLVVATGILILVAFCAIGIDTWAAIAALVSGGTLAAVFATLTAGVVALLIIAAIAAGITLVSVILWIIFCLFMSLKDIICALINFILFVLHLLMAISVVLGLVLAAIAAATEGASLGCAVGAFVDLAWFSIVEQIFFWIGIFTGCINPFSLFGLSTSSRRTG
jgi:hypothetical protein